LADSPGRFRQLGQLTGWQWRVLLGSPFILFITWSRLRSVGYKQTLRKAQPVKQSRLSAAEQLELAKDTAYALAVAVKYGPWKPLCLLRSLALGWFLGRKGIAFDVRIGVPGEKSISGSEGKLDFSAHAWVEHAGVVLNDKEDVTGDFNVFS